MHKYLVVIVVSLASTPSFASALSEAAADMEPGDWVLLETQGFDDGHLLDVDNGVALVFADEAVWDPITRRLFFIGAAHGGQEANATYVMYDEETNAWTTIPFTDYANFPLTHAYNTQALDPVTGTQFYYRFNRNDLYAIDTRDGESWQKILVDQEMWTGVTSTPGIAYFEEMDALIVYNAGRGTVWSYHLRTGQVTDLGDIPNHTNSAYEQLCKYDPVHQVVFFGGGKLYPDTGIKTLWKVDATGTITQATDSPVGMGTTYSVNTVDPASGELLVFSTTGSFHAYDADTNSWRSLDGSTVPFLASFRKRGVIATPIPQLGVTFFVVYNPDGHDADGVWLYRHSSFSPDETAPGAPQNLIID